MAESYLDYDKTILEVFAVGVVSSVIVLYYANEKITNNIFQILALILGFSILAYSFILSCGYNSKKRTLIDILKNPPCNLESEKYKIMKEKNIRLKRKIYPRVRWMAEYILLFIALLYFGSFYFLKDWIILIPFIIIIIFILMSIIANLKSLEKTITNPLKTT